MRILAAKILVPQIVVSVELDERNGAMLFCDGTEDGQADGVIAADANATHASVEKRHDSLLNAEKGVLDGKRIHGKIAEVRDSVLGEWTHLQDRIPGANDRGLHADISRPEARARAIRCAAIEGDPDEGNFQFFGLRNVRQTHKGRDAGEAGVGEGIERLGMRQAKGAAGFRHGEAS